MGQPKSRASATVRVMDTRRTKGCKYSSDAHTILPTVWATSGGLCGKYLAVSMNDLLDAMEAEGCPTRSPSAQPVPRSNPNPGSSRSTWLLTAGSR